MRGSAIYELEIESLRANFVFFFVWVAEWLEFLCCLPNRLTLKDMIFHGKSISMTNYLHKLTKWNDGFCQFFVWVDFSNASYEKMGKMSILYKNMFIRWYNIYKYMLELNWIELNSIIWYIIISKRFYANNTLRCLFCD